MEFVPADEASFSCSAENTEGNSKKKENRRETEGDGARRAGSRLGARVTEARAKRRKMDRWSKGESRGDEKKTARGWANGLLAK